MAIARLNGEVIAESSETITVDGHRYFPPQSIRAELLRPTSTRNDGHYYSIIVHGHATPDCARDVLEATVPDPRLAHHLEFFGPVVVED
ncbi:MAG TPA: DUF427 domain-containing protein [Pseudonocardiaceae bacterium]|jgi:uncharacterized protein (DUF427 family)|nr:DUF427 domain-containing protein [Pseudonocardiaceae bacterium]